MPPPPYVPLWVKSSHSFLEGASHPEDLVDRAHAHGLPAMALTDRDGLYGAVKAYARAKELREGRAEAGGEGRAPPRHVVGAEVTLAGELESARPAIETEGAWSDGTGPSALRAWRPKLGEPPVHGHARSRVVLLAEDREGYGRLSRLLTLGHARAAEKGASRVTYDEVRDAHGGLVALAPTAEVLLELSESHAGHLYAMVARHLTPEDAENERELRAAARRCGVPTVAAVEVLYHDRTRQPLQDVLSCVRFHRTLTSAGRLLRPNAEHELLSAASFSERFHDDPQSVRRTLEVAERCAFGLGALRYRYPAERVPLGQTEKSWLRSLTEAGALERYGVTSYGAVDAEVRAQIDKELSLIEELDYGGYFLTMWDVIRFCREKRILCQGRGSAANSVVCFCLGITAIDPVRMDLLFERFLSRERAEPPDIDVDIEHERREEVIQYVYERWGRRRAAMVANLIRYRLKSALRDVGKVLGLPEIALDRASKILSRRDDVAGSPGLDVDATVIREAGLDPEAAVTKHLLTLTAQIQDFPRHLGIHPGGFLLGHEPVDTLCPVEKATMPGRTVVQWDKQDVEDLGLFKVDLLGLGCLTVVHKAFDTLREKDEIDLGIATVPVEDVATYAMISRADTVGVFQIESRAQMAMLPRLAPRTFYDLVIEVALVRPGPIQGDMVHPYLRRRAGKEKVEFPHPKLERVLAKTLGVPIFQEQVMKLAVLSAGYTPGEADQLRRDMAAWRSKGRIERHREKLVSRMVEDGVPLDFAERVFSQIEGFGEYGFPESHAASFALLAYVTAWLKCHHPAHFACALLNAWPMGFYHPSSIVDDVKRHGVPVLAIDLGKSHWDCTLEPVARKGWGIRMGLRYVRGLGERERVSIETAKSERPFSSLVDFVRRARLNRGALERIASAGALEGFGLPRRELLWELKKLADERKDEIDLVSGAPGTRARFPRLGSAETIAWDYRTSLHSTRGHPMQELRAYLEDRGIPDARAVGGMRDGERVRVAGLVICRQRPGTKTGVTFLTLEDETGFCNVVAWRDVFDRFEVVGKTATLLEVEGRIQSEEGVVHVVAERLSDLSESVRAAASGVEKSRDFH